MTPKESGELLLDLVIENSAKGIAGHNLWESAIVDRTLAMHAQSR